MTRTRESVIIRAIKECLKGSYSKYKIARKYNIAERTLAILDGIAKRYVISRIFCMRKHWNSR